MNKKNILIVLLLVLVISFSFISCEQSNEQSNEQSTNEVKPFDETAKAMRDKVFMKLLPKLCSVEDGEGVKTNGGTKTFTNYKFTVEGDPTEYYLTGVMNMDLGEFLLDFKFNPAYNNCTSLKQSAKDPNHIYFN